MPARSRQAAEQTVARGLLVQMHRLRIELRGERDDLLACDDARPILGHLAGREILPMHASHGRPLRC